MTTPEPRPLKVTLVSRTQYPIGTLYYVWAQSRSNAPLNEPEWYEMMSEHGTIDIASGILDTVKQLLQDDVPVLENIHFTFHLENIPISLREQLIRHRIGVQVGERTGMDIIPELGSSSFWSQTSRMVPMDNFFSDGRYILPDSADDTSVSQTDSTLTRKQVYETTLEFIETAYKRLLASGMPMEDVRQIIPLGATHGMTWTLSLKALIHIVGKRACWISQYSVWGKAIQQMVSELREKVHPIFATIVKPPCMSNGKYVGCPIAMINQDRFTGVDPYPPCPLYCNKEVLNRDNTVGTERYYVVDGDLLTLTPSEDQRLHTMKGQFEDLWKIDCKTGEPIG